jgi:hypothetical protein
MPKTATPTISHPQNTRSHLVNQECKKKNMRHDLRSHLNHLFWRVFIVNLGLSWSGQVAGRTEVKIMRVIFDLVGGIFFDGRMVSEIVDPFCLSRSCEISHTRHKRLCLDEGTNHFSVDGSKKIPKIQRFILSFLKSLTIFLQK